MPKKHSIISIAIAVITVIVLQTFIAPSPSFGLLIPLRLLWLAVVLGYNYWYLKSLGKLNWWILLRSALLFVGLYALYSIVPTAFLGGLFLISSALVIGFFEWLLGNFSENLVLNETLFMAFGLFISLAAANWYFPKFQILYTLAIFLSSFLLVRSAYEFIPQPPMAKNVAAAVLALLCSEMFWVFTLLPFHYSVLGLLLFNIFYFCFILNYYYFINTFSYKKVQLHLILLVFTSLIILSVTPWRIIS